MSNTREASGVVYVVSSFYDWSLANRVFKHRWQADYEACQLFEPWSSDGADIAEMEAILTGAFSFEEAAAILDEHMPWITEGWLICVSEHDLDAAPLTVTIG